MGILQPGYPGEPRSHGDAARRGCLAALKIGVVVNMSTTHSELFLQIITGQALAEH